MQHSQGRGGEHRIAQSVDRSSIGVVDKIVTFLCSGRFPHSYMAYGSLAMSLMLDFKCIINPHIAYGSEDDFTDTGMSERICKRLRRVLAVQLELPRLLEKREIRSEF